MSTLPVQSLHQRLEQRQTLSPQMLQRLEVLQAPLMELRALVRRELEQNPLLEEMPTRDTPIEGDEAAPEAAGETAGETAEELNFDEKFDVLSRLDDDWREYFARAGATQDRDPEAAERHDRLVESLTRPESLAEHLLAQLSYLSLSADDRAIATLLIGSLNGDGYLNVTLGELAETTGYALADLERVLQMLQELDPPGVAARDLRECLLLQLRRSGRADSVEAAIVRDHLHDLAERKYAEIARRLGVSVAEVYRAAEAIAALEPRPGRPFDSEPPGYVTPEVSFVPSADGYTAQLRRDRQPRLRLRRDYREMLENPDTPEETRRYLREKFRAGDALIRSIEERQQTLLAIANEIARRQRGFFERGPAGLVPMTMAEIGAALGLHETTVSRAVNGKYAETPHGIVELRRFFTSGFAAPDGSAVSSETVKEAIARMIAEEDARAPLSDLDIAQKLAEQGIRIARRTVAKYREELGLPPSHQRRV